jgi:hypothetical protein
MDQHQHFVYNERSLGLTHTETAAQAANPTSPLDKHAPYVPDRHSRYRTLASNLPRGLGLRRELGVVVGRFRWISREVVECVMGAEKGRMGDPM